MDPGRVERTDVGEKVRQGVGPVDKSSRKHPGVGGGGQLGRNGVAGRRAARAGGRLVLDGDGRLLAEAGDERAPSVAEEVAGLGEAPAGVAVGSRRLPVLRFVLLDEKRRGRKGGGEGVLSISLLDLFSRF